MEAKYSTILNVVNFNEPTVQMPFDHKVSSIPDSPVNIFNTCSGCGHVIIDSAFLLVDSRYWHVTCLKCNACALPLNGCLSCFVKDGNIFCRSDYQRLYKSRLCSHCGLVIESHEFVMRVHDRVFHATKVCFFCINCHKPLMPGENFVYYPPGVVCTSCAHERGPDLFDLRSRASRPRKRKSSSPQQLDSIRSLTGSLQDELHGDTERQGYPQAKAKRMRTSFKPDQLRAMKSYFQCNHNPDATALKQLSNETRLSKRVLQVWFQNARAKHRRSCAQEAKRSQEQIKEETKEEESGGSMSDEASPDTFLYESSSHSDTSSEYQNSFSCPATYIQPSYDELCTSISSSVTSPSSLVSSILESVQAISSPCSLTVREPLSL